MTFVRTQITSTNDADSPRVLHLGNEVIWYVYRRADGALYLQRESGGVQGLEILVCQNVNRVDAVVDPDDTKAWIYFTNDGALWRIEVTDKNETPTTQSFVRSAAGWYERVSAGFGMGLDAVWGYPDQLSGALRRDGEPAEIWPPFVNVFSSPTAGQRILLVQAGLVKRGTLSKFRIYQNTDVGGAGWQHYVDVLIPAGAAFVTLDVPRATGGQVFLWAAVAIREVPTFLESPWSNVERDDAGRPQNTGDLSRGGITGAGLAASWATVDRVPLKVAPPPDYVFGGITGAGMTSAWATVNRAPIKLAPLPDIVIGGIAGNGFDSRWILNGTDILAP